MNHKLTLLVLWFVLILQACSISTTSFESDVHTIKVTKGDTSYELSGNIESFNDYGEIHKLIDLLPKENNAN